MSYNLTPIWRTFVVCPLSSFSTILIPAASRSQVVFDERLDGLRTVFLSSLPKRLKIKASPELFPVFVSVNLTCEPGASVFDSVCVTRSDALMSLTLFKTARNGSEIFEPVVLVKITNPSASTLFNEASVRARVKLTVKVAVLFAFTLRALGKDALIFLLLIILVANSTSLSDVFVNVTFLETVFLEATGTSPKDKVAGNATTVARYASST